MRKQFTAIVLFTAAGLAACNSNRDDSYQSRTRDNSSPAVDSSRPANRSNTANNGAATDNNRAGQQYVAPDARILSILHAKNQEEIQIGRLAQENGASEQVKRFGEQLVRDHNEMDAKVMSISRETGINLMSAEEVKQMCAKEKGVSAPDKDPVAELRSMRGAQFDSTFGTMMHEGHADLIQKVEAAQQTVREQKVRDLLAQTLQKLREHERAASDIMNRSGR